ncbi:hypothetical protein [Tomitella gaofuii]|uniref:hypothetical protein n=1 Tax=Tomitella gaofuii TaxID=2760083 RepID=UPI0015FD0975|nr:hypothetical protein [Tomitella gaofuii]
MKSASTTTQLLAVVGGASALVLTAAGIASASTAIDHAGDSIQASAIGDIFNPGVQIVSGAYALNCESLTASGTVPTGNDASNPDWVVNSGTGGIDVPIDNVAFTNCNLNGTPATIAVTNTTASPWLINVNHDSGSPIGTLKIPANGAVVTAGTCTIDVDQASEITNIPYSNATGVAAASNSGTINFTSHDNGDSP